MRPYSLLRAVPLVWLVSHRALWRGQLVLPGVVLRARAFSEPRAALHVLGEQAVNVPPHLHACRTDTRQARPVPTAQPSRLATSQTPSRPDLRSSLRQVACQQLAEQAGMSAGG